MGNKNRKFCWPFQEYKKIQLSAATEVPWCVFCLTEYSFCRVLLPVSFVTPGVCWCSVGEKEDNAGPQSPTGRCEPSSLREGSEEKLLWISSSVDLLPTVTVFRVKCTYFISDTNKTNVSNKYKTGVLVRLLKSLYFFKIKKSNSSLQGYIWKSVSKYMWNRTKKIKIK